MENTDIFKSAYTSKELQGVFPYKNSNIVHMSNWVGKLFLCTI